MIDVKKPGYFSFWSYDLYSKCPRRYKLQVVDKVPKAEVIDHGYITQGSVPHDLAEKFFLMPPKDRDLQMFFDEFENFYTLFVSQHHIDWERHKSDKELKQKTWKAVQNQVRMIEEEGLTRLETLPELSFREKITDEISLGGRIDLLSKVGENTYDIVDWKASRSVDPQQLMIYVLGMRAQRKTIRKASFFMLREGKVHPEKITDIKLYQLMKALQHARQLIAAKNFGANFNHYTCRWCDVNTGCETYVKATEGLDRLPAGNVKF